MTLQRSRLLPALWAGVCACSAGDQSNTGALDSSSADAPSREDGGTPEDRSAPDDEGAAADGGMPEEAGDAHPTMPRGAAVSADFGSRTGAGMRIPARAFTLGGAGSGLQDTAAIGQAVQAGFTGTGIDANLGWIYATTTPNFSNLDWDLGLIKKAGLKPLILIEGTPPSLQPPANACAPASAAPPTSYGTWASLAGAVVAHIDQKFPGLADQYEIWNEPDSQVSLCVQDDTDATRLATYLQIFAAAAPVLRAQGAHDNISLRTGGPTLASAHNGPTWLGQFLASPSTAPFVDFVAYHVYPSGHADIANGMTWDGNVSLLAITQSSNGLAASYQTVAASVAKGSQPLGPSTPIYVSEYNDNWAFEKDCCRNDPTYGSLWNSLAVIDFLNLAYAGVNALPSLLGYYGASYVPYFCMFGAINANMDCDRSAYVPYPQYYTYELMLSSGMLGLSAGGTMASSVSTPSVVMGTAFYTASKDSVVLINPYASDQDLTVSFVNPGLSPHAATYYLLNEVNPTIRTQSVAFSESSGSYQVYISLPAHSTGALTLE